MPLVKAMDKRAPMRGMAMGLTLAVAAAVGPLGASPAAAGSHQAPGERFVVRAADLPQPGATPSAANLPRRIARPPDAGLRVPPGFAANIFASPLSHPRWLAVAPNGDVFLAESGAGKITVLSDADRDGRAETVATYFEGLEWPHGMAFRDGAFYVADTRAVWRFAYRPGDLKAHGPPEPVTAPGALGAGHGHRTRGLVFAPDGAKFYVAVGSAGNIGEESPPRATILEFSSDGASSRVLASGLRNPVGIAFRPGTGDLWTVVNERDGMGDGLVPDFLTRVVDGAFYGWPYAYIGANPQPGYAHRRPDLVARSRVPDLLFQSHSAPIGLVFYAGNAFPAEYRGDAFVALRGSWNSGAPTGYMVVRVPFRGGEPAGHYETFASGFWLEGTETARVWGRPSGLAVAADGALLIADDTGGAVWRIAWVGGSRAP
ncbi:MAG: PQQ-dependent sugar dehydrogenase [Pseudomonadota bacterium]